MLKRLLATLLALLLLICSWGLGEALVDGDIAVTDALLVEYGYDYMLAEEVALYLHAFEELPPNYITKSQARDWDLYYDIGDYGTEGWGYCIGGDTFGNREGLLPEARGRNYYECDVNYDGSGRGPERLVLSNDGLIYYTANHYENYELLYAGWYYEDGWYAWD